MVYVTGDVHSDWMARLHTAAFPEQRGMTKDDHVIICGDMGIWDRSKSENYNLDWLEKKSFTTLFVDGNHENYDILDSLEQSEWNGGRVHFLRPSVIHLMRGQIYQIEGRSFFTFGGARSHDIRDGILEPGDPRIKTWRKRHFKQFRVNHESWWAREMPSEEEMDEGRKNLEKVGNKVDYIITHCPYTSLQNRMDPESVYLPDPLTDYLEEIRQNVEYRHWLFGHMHMNRTFQDEKASCLYEQIVRVV